MSDATLRTIHEAIAKHIADECDDEVLLLTDWNATVAAAIASDPSQTLYLNIGADAPYHHRLGLIHRGLEMLVNGTEDD
ncbi:hypothetical protein ACFRJ8_14800 [Arthrobacter sp. NPDC056886]|uniref:hypothetical protein n=1 Tax=Arthrobacter sp. NPDC056886 TaxID=3345960 RepID=UPI00366EAD59